MTPKPSPRLARLIDAAARVTGIGVLEIRSRSRLPYVVNARRAIAYLAIRRAGCTTIAVGAAINRDRTTVIYLVGSWAAAAAKSGWLSAATAAIWEAAEAEAAGRAACAVRVQPAKKPDVSRGWDFQTRGDRWMGAGQLARQEAAFRRAFLANCEGRNYAG